MSLSLWNKTWEQFFFWGGETLKNKFYLNNFKLIKCYKNKQIKEYGYIFTQIPLGNSFY